MPVFARCSSINLVIRSASLGEPPPLLISSTMPFTLSASNSRSSSGFTESADACAPSAIVPLVGTTATVSLTRSAR